MTNIVTVPYTACLPGNISRASATVRRQVLRYENYVAKSAANAPTDWIQPTNLDLFGDSLKIYTQSYEYYRIKKLAFTFNYTGNWLAAQGSANLVYVQDPDRVPQANVHYDDIKLLRFGNNVIWEVPVRGAWLHTMLDKDRRKSCDGATGIFNRPGRADPFPNVAPYSVFVDAQFEFANKTRLTNSSTVITYKDIGTGLQDNTMFITERNDQRDIWIDFKTKAAPPSGGTFTKGFYVFREPALLTYTLKGPGEKLANFAVVITRADFHWEKDAGSGYILISIPTDVGERLDWLVTEITGVSCALNTARIDAADKKMYVTQHTTSSQ